MGTGSSNGSWFHGHPPTQLLETAPLWTVFSGTGEFKDPFQKEEFLKGPQGKVTHFADT